MIMKSQRSLRRVELIHKRQTFCAMSEFTSCCSNVTAIMLDEGCIIYGKEVVRISDTSSI